jgi:exonuclease SbcC
MLSRLVGINFQKHERVEVIFDPVLTVIVGPTDSGKSALLRLLRWISLNTPDGDSFVRMGSEKCWGTLFLDDRKVIRKRGKGINLYKLDRKTFKSFGRGNIPEEISNFVNLGPLNFQGQHDPPFWFLDPPGKVSRELNSVIDLGVIDSSLSNATGEVRKAQARVELGRERLEQAEEKVKALSWVNDFCTDVNSLTVFHTDLERIRLRFDRLGSLIKGVGEASLEVDRLSAASLEGKSTVEKGERVIRLRNRVETLRELLNRVKTAEEERQQWQENHDDMVKELQRKAGGICPLCGSPFPSQLSAQTST